jgi:hypothetical protein
MSSQRMGQLGFMSIWLIAISLQVWRDPYGSWRLSLPEFLDSRHMKVIRLLPKAPTAYIPRRYPWYSFLEESESTPGL